MSDCVGHCNISNKCVFFAAIHIEKQDTSKENMTNANAILLTVNGP